MAVIPSKRRRPRLSTAYIEHAGETYQINRHGTIFEPPTRDARSGFPQINVASDTISSEVFAKAVALGIVPSRDDEKTLNLAPVRAHEPAGAYKRFRRYLTEPIPCESFEPLVVSSSSAELSAG